MNQAITLSSNLTISKTGDVYFKIDDNCGKSVIIEEDNLELDKVLEDTFIILFLIFITYGLPT